MYDVQSIIKGTAETDDSSSDLTSDFSSDSESGSSSSDIEDGSPREIEQVKQFVVASLLKYIESGLLPKN